MRTLKNFRVFILKNLSMSNYKHKYIYNSMHIHASICLLVDKTKGININPNSGSVRDMCNRAQSYYAFVIQWVFDSTGVCKPNVWWNISILVAVVREPLIAWKIRELDGKELAVGSPPTYEDYVRLCTSQFVSYLSFGHFEREHQFYNCINILLMKIAYCLKAHHT